MQKRWYAVIAVGVLIVAAAAALFLIPAPERESSAPVVTLSPDLTSYFKGEITSRAVADVGQPIEGFTPEMLMEAFPGLRFSDFAGIDALGGHYELKGAYQRPTLVRRSSRSFSTADGAITSDGYAEILTNITKRLDLKIEDKDDINTLLQNFDTAEHLRVKIDESAEAFGIQITPKQILEDSRCPQDAQCIQKGGVKVSAEVKTASATKQVTFALNQSKIIDGKSVQLLSVLPLQQTGKEISASDYQFTFWVQKPISDGEK